MTEKYPTFINSVLTYMSLWFDDINMLSTGFTICTYVRARGAKKCLYLSIKSVM